jgi:zinc D-Ala-D-Ala carboxypeptidase
MTMITSQENWQQDWCNFTPDEVKCSHCGELKINSDIMDLLQQARNDLGPLSITSGYRCSEHNNNISSTGPNGPHTTGKALDISVKDSKHRKELITYFAPKVPGLGIAKSFIHIDILTAEDGFEMRPNSWVY